MSRIALLIAVLALFVLAGSQSIATPPLGVNYDWEGGFGELRILHAEGRPFEVYDGAWGHIVQGIVPANHFNLPVHNIGPGEHGATLHVVIPPVTFHIDRDDDWFWD